MTIRLVSRFVDLLIFSGLWVALSAGLLTFSTTQFFELKMSSAAGLITGGSTAAMYGYIGLIQSFKRKGGNLRQFKQISLFLTGLAGALIVVNQQENINEKGFAVLAVGFILSLLYPLRIFGFSLRELAGLKIFIVTAVWFLSCFVFPLALSNQFQIFSGNYAVGGIAFWLLLLAATIPFDMRDFKSDRPEMKTIPRLVGLKNAQILVFALISVSAILWIVASLEWTDGPFLLLSHLAIALGIFDRKIIQSHRMVPLIFEGALMMPALTMLIP